MSTSTTSEKRRVLLVDDHPIVRHGLGLLIDQEKDLMVCGETSSAVETLDNFKQMEADIAVVDISLQGTSGLELTKALKEIQPSLPILVLSMHDEMPSGHCAQVRVATS
jgi:DNA-binding NarL/FixJ family response regulator